MLWSKDSSAAVPFGTLLALLSLWLFVSIPLTFVGAYFGFRDDKIQAPVRTNQIPRQVPEQTLYTKPLPGMLMGGILPFGCIFIQLFFILNSIWFVIILIGFYRIFINKIYIFYFLGLTKFSICSDFCLLFLLF